VRSVAASLLPKSTVGQIMILVDGSDRVARQSMRSVGRPKSKAQLEGHYLVGDEMSKVNGECRHPRQVNMKDGV